jgi:hypothetical protein
MPLEFNRKEILEKIKTLNFPLGQYVVIGSGLLAILKIRPAKDIDISVLPELYEKLYKSEKWQKEKRWDKVFLKKDNIEINPQLSWSDYKTSTEEAIKSATIIDNIPFLNLGELKKFKEALGRDKDKEDIKLIDDYLNNSKID